MTVKERMLTIRLMQKLRTRPAYQERLGMVVRESKGKEVPVCRKDIKC